MGFELMKYYLMYNPQWDELVVFTEMNLLYWDKRYSSYEYIGEI
jgi:hypothetical protein